MMKKTIFGACALLSLLGIAACDNTYTPGAHHQEAASTGSMLSGTDTGADTDGNTNAPSITSNLGNRPGGGGH